jgi:hypothetical protein
LRELKSHRGCLVLSIYAQGDITISKVNNYHSENNITISFFFQSNSCNYLFIIRKNQRGFFVWSADEARRNSQEEARHGLLRTGVHRREDESPRMNQALTIAVNIPW